MNGPSIAQQAGNLWCSRTAFRGRTTPFTPSNFTGIVSFVNTQYGGTPALGTDCYSFPDGSIVCYFGTLAAIDSTGVSTYKGDFKSANDGG